MSDAITWIDADRAFEALDDRALVDALIEGHRRGVDDAARIVLEQPGFGGAADRHFLVLPAWMHGEAMGAKLVTSFPDNPAEGRPAVHAVYALFDGRTGAPRSLIDGEALTFRKTACDSACGAHFLCRKDARTMLMVGAGALARHLVRAHRAVRPSLTRVIVWNRTPDKAATLADRLAADGLEAKAVADLEASVAEADLVCCATGSQAPLIRGALLKPGAHLDLVGGFTPAMREADDDCIRRTALFCDGRSGAVGACGDFTQPIETGAMKPADVQADLTDLASGRHPGRRDEREITLYKNAGGGHLDLIAARAIAAAAG